MARHLRYRYNPISRLVTGLDGDPGRIQSLLFHIIDLLGSTYEIILFFPD
jgi:hypothetical protein